MTLVGHCMVGPASSRTNQLILPILMINGQLNLEEANPSAMPVSRCRGDEAPEAALQAFAMAGLVGILRQLGDLAEFAADVFQDLHDQLMEASARGSRLAVRAKQLEADFINQDDDAAAPSRNTAGMQSLVPCPAEEMHLVAERLRWHADHKVSHGVVAGGGREDLPCFVAEYIKQCRGPPALSILDKYDAEGDGACLRRYTDPSFFRTNSSKTIIAEAHRRGKTSGSICLKPNKLQQNINQKYEYYSRSSELDRSFISSGDHYTATTEKAKEHQQANTEIGSEAGSDYGELGRTTSFEAWLFPIFCTSEHEVTEESYEEDTHL